jgi:pseudaminic acid biosynthesis-associated methylase
MSDFEARGRLEELWAGSFGDAYVDRNAAAHEGRRAFWAGLVERLEPDSALEVGCNVGANLRWIAEALGPERVAGVDVNARALETLRERLPGVDGRLASGARLPFEDRAFDLTFTMGVLIHQDPDDLAGVMAEVVRCSRRWVLCGEYYAAEPTEVPYRGLPGALFKRDFGALYEERFPELRLEERGFLPRGDGSWDDVTYWVFERPSQ